MCSPQAQSYSPSIREPVPDYNQMKSRSSQNASTTRGGVNQESLSGQTNKTHPYQQSQNNGNGGYAVLSILILLGIIYVYRKTTR